MKRLQQINNRPGVTLLFVISMIVLFLLMGTAFVVVSNDFMRSSQSRSRVTVNNIRTVGEFQGERYLQQALYDLLRGPDLNNVNSPLRGHSLLGDMYGYGLTSYVKDVEVMANLSGGQEQQFLRLELLGANVNIHDNLARITRQTLETSNLIAPAIIGNDVLSGDEITAADLGNAPGRFNGLILSFVSGPMEGVCCRIVDHQVLLDAANTFNHRFVVLILNQPETFEVGLATSLIPSLEQTPNELPTRVVINRRPFAGTGAGIFTANTGSNALSPAAMRPNRKGEDRQLVTRNYLGRQGLGANPFSTNESYDAVDEQNMFLAGPNAAGMLQPSFHRPATLAAATSFRPEFNMTANRNFPDIIDPMTGMPYTFANRPFDVDHTGDGNRDGVWTDIGLPIFTTVDGRRVKPLVSYLVADLDGKININVHGNRSQLDISRLVSGNDTAFASEVTTFQAMNPNALRGMGFGPAEVSLSRVFGNEEAERLMVGELMDVAGGLQDVVIPGRYGFDEDNARRRTAGGGPVPGRPASMSADGEEPFFSYKAFGLPLSNNALADPGILGRHYQSSPMDIYGRMQMDFPNTQFLVDEGLVLPPDFPSAMPVGMPTSSVFNSSFVFSERFNSPYEVDFSPPGQQLGPNNDQLFTLQELEYVYRLGDPDFTSNANNRILELANSLANPNNRFLATTDSWEVPTTYHEFLTDPNQMGVNRAETLTTKLYSILNQSGAGGTAGVGINETDVAMKHQLIYAHMTGFAQDSETTFGKTIMVGGTPIPTDQFSLLSVDVRAGRPFNINQPFGDGIDNNSNQIIDDNAENSDMIPHPSGNRAFDHENDSFVAGSVLNAKRQFARQLFVLILLTTELVDRDNDGSIFDGTGLDPGDFFDFNNSGGQSNNLDRLAYRELVAQWVANIVDFRDADSIRTGFEFDLNPWNGWDVDGDLSTDNSGQAGLLNYRVFWGMERPDLLITESIAMHDVRTEDRDDDDDADDPMGVPDSQTVEEGDEDFDSRLVPQASALVELYNPWVAGSQIAPAEFGNQNGVDLAQQTPGMFPVWRMVVLRNSDVFGAIYSSGDEGFNPTVQDFDNINLNTQNTDDEVVRMIYFNNPSLGSTGNQFVGNKVYRPVDGIGNTVIRPGHFAVIGSMGQEFSADEYTTVISRNENHMAETPIDLNITRRIVLDTTGDGQVRVYDSLDFANPDLADDVTVLPMVGPQLTDMSNPTRSLGFSEPVLGYFGINEFADNNEEEEGQIFVEPGTMTPLTAPLDVPADKAADAAFYDNFLVQNEVTSGAYILVLQRLANPLEDWDAMTNPYLTVDSMGCDLYSYNGIEGETEAMPMDQELEYFSTYERRGDRRMGNDAGQRNTDFRLRMLWKTEYTGLNPNSTDASNQTNDMAAVPATDRQVLNRDLEHSLGRMNAAYVDAESDMTPGTELPFAWLNWNNRPFANAYELTNVPFTTGSFLTSRFDTSLVDSNVIMNAYERSPDVESGSPSVEDRAYRYRFFSGEFPHLLNFFDAQIQLARLLDYVEVPSPYLGTEKYINPGNYYASAGDSHSIARGFAPPYDYVSNYRVPGKINVNTVFDQSTWEALVGIDPSIPNSNIGRVSFSDWQRSRDISPHRPAVAFNRVASASDVVPPSATGLFRAGPGGSPIFDYDPDPFTEDELNNSGRSAYFRYHERQRISNSITNRSSMFAIWIQVGYFEVDSANLLGAEYEDENFQTSQDRAFFIVDRSIPVAFEPGKNHNVDRAIRVSSFIE